MTGNHGGTGQKGVFGGQQILFVTKCNFCTKILQNLQKKLFWVNIWSQVVTGGQVTGAQELYKGNQKHRSLNTIFLFPLYIEFSMSPRDWPYRLQDLSLSTVLILKVFPLFTIQTQNVHQKCLLVFTQLQVVCLYHNCQIRFSNTSYNICCS